jgi:hypothetical protein
VIVLWIVRVNRFEILLVPCPAVRAAAHAAAVVDDRGFSEDDDFGENRVGLPTPPSEAHRIPLGARYVTAGCSFA